MSTPSTERTGVVLKVHTSNYRVEGFTAEVSARELATLARERDMPLVDDLGSGTLLDLVRFGSAARADRLARRSRMAPTSSHSPATSCSADRRPASSSAAATSIARVNRNPLKRALRIDKIRLAAIEATLRALSRSGSPERTAADAARARAQLDDIDACARRARAGRRGTLVGDGYCRRASSAARARSARGALPVETLPERGAGASAQAKHGARARARSARRARCAACRCQ